MKMIKTTNSIYGTNCYGTMIGSKALYGATVCAITPVNIVPLTLIIGGIILFGLDAIMDHGYAFSVENGDTMVSFGPGTDSFFPR